MNDEIVVPERKIPFPNTPVLLPDEMYYSYLQRLSMANGYKRIMAFIGDNVRDKKSQKWDASYVPSYDCNSGGLDLGFSIPKDDLYLRTSLYSALACLMTWGLGARYVNSFFNRRSAKNTLVGVSWSLTQRIRRCPVCWEEDTREYGTPYYHRMHNIPGVTVCAKHGCALEEYTGIKGFEMADDSFKSVQVLPKAEEYAAFAEGLLEERIQSSFTDISRAVGSRMAAKYGELFLHSLIYCPDDIEHLPYYAKYPKTTISSFYTNRRNFSDFPGTIAMLTYLFESAHDFAQTVNTVSPKGAFMKEVSSGRIKLLSPYRDTFVRVRCRKCGHEFGTTPHAQVVGMGCPECTKNLTNKQFLRKMYDKVCPDYRLDSELKDMNTVIQMTDRKSGESFSMGFDRFVNFGRYTENGYEPVRIAPHQNAKSFDDFAEEVKQYGPFTLTGHDRVGYQHYLRIRHETCKRTFSVALWDFRVSPVCRKCNPRRTNTDTFRKKVEKESEGAFALEGEYSDGRTAVTIVHLETGTKITGSPNYVIDRIRAIRRQPEALSGKRTNREEIKKIINERIESWHGEVMFSADLADITDRRYITSYLNQLRIRGVIKSIADGVFCDAEKDFSFEEVLDAMYVIRHKKRIGLHCGDGFLKDLGFDIEDPVPLVVYNTEGSRISDPLKRRAMDTDYWILRSPVQINEENWQILTVLYFFKHCFHVNRFYSHKKATAVDKETVVSAIRRWLELHNKSLKDFAPYEKYFGDDVVRKVYKLYVPKDKEENNAVAQDI